MSDYRIKSVKGLEIIDSRGNPTVEATVELENGVTRAGSRTQRRIHRHV
jgi:enolase